MSTPIPVVNVNLAHCDTPHLCAANGGEHVSVCAARPVPILCPVRRSVTFTVRLGECCCTPIVDIVTMRPDRRSDCPARPVRISCSISGKTWEESEVVDVDADFDHPINTARQMEMARERWALAKALVLGRTYTLAARFPPAVVDAIHRLHMQRDAVFAALADMAQAEEAKQDALASFLAAVHRSGNWAPVLGEPSLNQRTSVRLLERYVGRLVEQVAVLP